MTAEVTAEPEPGVFRVAGPVQAEIMVLALAGGNLVLTGPCGAAPWYVEVGQGADPTAIVTAVIRANVAEPAVVHSTSWRHARGGVVLTFVAVIDAAVLDAAAAGRLQRVPVERAALARGAAASAPEHVPGGAVIEHGLRHLAWLAEDDPVVAGALPAGWLAALGGYTQEPFGRL